jgi:hypothetical protein
MPATGGTAAKRTLGGERTSVMTLKRRRGDDTQAAARSMDSIADATIELPQHYIEIEGSLVQRALRSLKDGDAFAVFDNYGDIAVELGPTGLTQCYLTLFAGVVTQRLGGGCGIVLASQYKFTPSP